MRRILACTVFVGLTLPLAAFTQDALPTAGEAMGGAGGGGVVYKKETAYDFEADDINGALVKPEGADIGGEQHGKTSSLIKIRSDFVPELLKSVENI